MISRNVGCLVNGLCTIQKERLYVDKAAVNLLRVQCVQAQPLEGNTSFSRTNAFGRPSKHSPNTMATIRSAPSYRCKLNLEMERHLKPSDLNMKWVRLIIFWCLSTGDWDAVGNVDTAMALMLDAEARSQILYGRREAGKPRNSFENNL